jgi:hypothetical protein
MTVDLFTIKFTRSGLDYVRQILGARPYDEAGALTANIEVQRREQEQAAQQTAAAAAATPAPAPATVRALRAVKRTRPLVEDPGASAKS